MSNSSAFQKNQDSAKEAANSAGSPGVLAREAQSQHDAQVYRKTTERLIEIIAPLIGPLGYDIVHLEVHNQRHKVLRLFIERSEHDPQAPDKSGIGVEDCVAVTRALDEPLDQNPEVDGIFKGPYELEVSSPGVDRPLRLAKDYERFAGRRARIHVYRPLNAEELGDAEYQKKNPKQKNFLGVLKGLQGEQVLLSLESGAGDVSSGKNSRKKPKLAEVTSNGLLTIPYSLISKANLEPVFEFDDE